MAWFLLYVYIYIYISLAVAIPKLMMMISIYGYYSTVSYVLQKTSSNCYLRMVDQLDKMFKVGA